MEAANFEGSGALTSVPGPPLHAPLPALGALRPNAPGLIPSGIKVQRVEGERINTQREWNKLRPELQGSCSSTLGPNPTPAPWDPVPLPIGQRLSLRIGEDLVTSGCGSSPSVSSTTSHQGDCCQHTLGEGMIHAHFISSSPNKVPGHIDCIGMFPHKDRDR